jgi:hypothetical protein
VAIAREALDRPLTLPRVEIVVVDAAQVEIALDAYPTYGRASGHPARLNHGDVFAYALARARDVPLAVVGDGFSLTDLRSLRLARRRHPSARIPVGAKRGCGHGGRSDGPSTTVEAQRPPPRPASATSSRPRWASSSVEASATATPSRTVIVTVATALRRLPSNAR